MADKFKTPNAFRAFFNVRQYKANVPTNQQALIPDDGNIKMLLDCGVYQPTWCGGFESRYTDKQGNKQWSVKVKIGATCRFYNTDKQLIPRPSNTDLERGHYEVIAVGSILPKDPHNQLKASGLWASHIMLHEIEVNPFDENDNFGNATTQYTPPQPAPQVTATEPQQPQPVADNLPF